MDKFFKLTERGTTVGTEIRAGIATFLTMAYIIVVNPNILSASGMAFSDVLFATVIVSALSSIMMGLFANLPFALAPGMGINAMFTFTICLGMGVPWQTALGAVFISGLIFILLSVFKIRDLILKAIPASIRYAVAAGIGLFLALIGLINAKFIIANPATVVGFGGLTVQTGLFLFGLFLTGILVVFRVKGALIIGIAGTTAVSYIVSLMMPLFGGTPFMPAITAIAQLPTFGAVGKLDILGALKVTMIMPIFTLLFTDMFDSLSTFVGVAEVGGFIDEKTGQPKNVNKALITDAVSTTISGIFGTSSGTTYIESAAGVEEGGRTGLTAVVTGLLFIPFMFLWPLLSVIPAAATSPILVLIGLFMLKPLIKINWTDFEEAIPAFLALILIPLTYSITQGIVWGFLSYTIIKLLRGKFKDIHPALYVVDAFAILALVAPMIKI
jgi:AGZA family xanthine/uracil permease-like MFS transporter